MADICKCQYDKCPKKDNCFRFTVQASEWQSYAEFQNICNEETNYQYFWEIKK